MKDKWVSATKRVDKPWGHEEIFALSAGKYCGKAIHVTAGHALSLQYHEQKEETISIFSGTAFVEVGKDEAELDGFDMLPGESIHLLPGTRHRVTAVTDIIMLEASTTELWDVVRLDDRYGREGTNEP